MSYFEMFEFTAAVRGYHYYRKYWHPQEGQILDCHKEPNNPFDRFAIKVCECQNDIAVGHLPKEMSRITKYFMDRGGEVSVSLKGKHYRRSPLVQGGLEIPCSVCIKIVGTSANLRMLERYKELVRELYIEPKNEEILGSFLTLTDPDIEPRERAKDKSTQKKIGKQQEATQNTRVSRDKRNFREYAYMKIPFRVRINGS